MTVRFAAVQPCCMAELIAKHGHLDLPLQAVCAILVILDGLLHSRWDQLRQRRAILDAAPSADLQ